jgi:CBS domain-containing protein
MAAIDPVSFVRATPPFDELPKPLFDEAARSFDVVYVPAGTWLVRAGGKPLEYLYVIRKGSARLERDGQTLQVLEEGEIFGYGSLISGTATLDVRAEEELVAYRIPAAQFRRLLSDARFARHFAVGLAERLRSSLEQSPVAQFRSDLSMEVQTLVRRPPVWVGAAATIGEAARVMHEERISSVLVRTDPPGIVTDRDLRNRVLAEGRGGDTPVTEVLSRPLRQVATTTPIYQAWATLLDANVHHLPVVRDGDVVGVLTSTDLLRTSAQGPLAVLRRVERLQSRDALAGYAHTVAEMASSLLTAGLDVAVISGFVARLNDALLGRILRWAEDELGEPPAPYAWIVFGSEGRMEQTLLTDQDNALVYADEGEPHRDWFRRLAERANADLEAAGFPPCDGGYMARKWHGPLEEWKRRFAQWLDEPTALALLEASIFFDFRRVAGTLDLEVLDAIVADAPRKPVFLRFLAKNALDFRPPAGLLLRLRGESSSVDLKLHGISPIVFLARCYALEAGARARSTLERLDAALAAKLVDEDVWAPVVEAYRFLVGLRLRLQLRKVAGGRAATNQIALGELSAIERTRIKDSFRAIRAWQERATYHFRIDFG